MKSHFQPSEFIQFLFVQSSNFILVAELSFQPMYWVPKFLGFRLIPIELETIFALQGFNFGNEVMDGFEVSVFFFSWLCGIVSFLFCLENLFFCLRDQGLEIIQVMMVRS